MIDEQELYGLGDSGRGPDVSCRPVEEVLARGTRLRRRRRTLRLAGATTAVMGLVAAGFVAVDRSQDDPGPEVQAGPTSTETAGIAPPPPPPDCADDPSADPIEARGFHGPTPVPAADVPAAMRVLPTWTPGGDLPVTVAQGSRWTDPCPDTAPIPADPALVLVSADGNGDGVADATIRLSGPNPRPLSPNLGLSRTDTEIRGGPGLDVVPDALGDVLLAWTEPDGWSWDLSGMGVDEATVRAVAEALILNSQPADDEAVASLDPAMVPAGFTVAWQTIGTPVPVDPVMDGWTVEIGGNNGDDHVANRGIQCLLDVKTTSTGMPLSSQVGTSGTETTVNGQLAVWGSSIAGPGTALRWELSPGVIATAGCVDWDQPGLATFDRDTIVRLAESVVPVAADDPRLPVDPRLSEPPAG